MGVGCEAAPRENAGWGPTKGPLGCSELGSVETCLGPAVMLLVLRVCVASKKGMRGRETERQEGTFVSYEGGRMRGKHFSAGLLLHKPALRVGRKDFFFFFGRYLLKRIGETRAVWVDD